MDSAATYISLPSPTRTPDRMACLAKLLGQTPAEVSTANVLDIGCGQGWDLIALAYTYPDAHFTGIDLSEDAVLAGRAVIESLKLTNVELRCIGINQFKSNISFDYIICHGVYSWVAEGTSQAILQACHDLLTKNGLAYISYNALPAWATRSILREALRNFTIEAKDKLKAAREALEFMYDALREVQTPYANSLKFELENVKKSSDGFILQELLAENVRAEYLQEFIEKTKQHNLFYLSEAKIDRIVSRRLDELSDIPALCEAVKSLSNQRQQEQALDFLYPTWLRQAVVCRDDAPCLPQDITLKDKVLENLYIASPLVPSHPDDPEGGEDTFMSPNGSHIQITNKYLWQAIHKLNTTWPNYISLTELYDSLTNRPCYALSDLTSDLIPLYHKGLIELHTQKAPFIATITNTPKVSAVAQLQAERQTWVTNLKFEYTLITDFERHLIKFVDGQHDKAQLISAMRSLLDSNELSLKDEFKADLTEEGLLDMLTQSVDEALYHFSESALLLDNTN